ncbi:MAG: DUF6688 family protein [Planctomycetota bacterium]
MVGQALLLWPIYLVGVVVLIRGIAGSSPDWIVTSPWCLIHSITLSLISIAYVLAGIFFNFVNSSYELLIVPGAVAICYILLALVILKNRKYALSNIWELGALLHGWLAGFAAALILKIPLAWRLYQRLPDDPPSCFIVTAAARGHRSFVQSRYDATTGMWVNPQLETFRWFETKLQEVAPAAHWCLRAVYNRVGPIVARHICNLWLADAMYVLLKPLEWSIRVIRSERR